MIVVSPRKFVPWLALLVCGIADAAITDAPGIPQVRVEVTRRADTWTAEFIFDRSVTAWVFRRSDLTSETRRPWREENWSVVTRGVRLQRRGYYDLLTAERGELPRRVTVNRSRYSPTGRMAAGGRPRSVAASPAVTALTVEKTLLAWAAARSIAKRG